MLCAAVVICIFVYGIQCASLPQHQYDYNKTTEENWKAEVCSSFGKYYAERSLLDYSYHSCYDIERLIIHDRMLDSMLADVNRRFPDVNCLMKAKSSSWLLFTAGAMGSGKSHILRWMMTNSILNTSQYIHIDPDGIRGMLPETGLYNVFNASTAGYMTQKEVGYVCEVIGMGSFLTLHLASVGCREIRH